MSHFGVLQRKLLGDIERVNRLLLILDLLECSYIYWQVFESSTGIRFTPYIKYTHVFFSRPKT
jgi:hypothetical protein